jgi:ABC-type nitrate/sulfonate/bicarbonate transport system permease component
MISGTLSAMTSRMPAVVPRYMPLLLLAAGWEALTRTGIVPTAALPPLDTVAIA